MMSMFYPASSRVQDLAQWLCRSGRAGTLLYHWTNLKENTDQDIIEKGADESFALSSFSDGTGIHSSKQRVGGVSTQNSACDSLQHSRGFQFLPTEKTNVLTNKLVAVLMSAGPEQEHPPDSNNCDEKLFSDASEDEENDVIPSLIENLTDAVSESGSQSPKSSAKFKEPLYSSFSSVVQEPPSPTTNILARKCLSFKDATLTKNTNMASKLSEKKLASKISVDELETDAQVSRLQEAVKTSVKKHNATKAPMTSYTEKRNEEEEEFEIVEPNVNLGKPIDFHSQKSEIIRESAIHDLSMNRRNNYKQKKTHAKILLDPNVFINTATARQIRSTFVVSDPSTSGTVKPVNVDTDLKIDNIPEFSPRILTSMKSKALRIMRTTKSSEFFVHKHNVQSDIDLPQEERFEKNVLIDEDFSPEEMATVKFLPEEDFLEGAKHQNDPTQKDVSLLQTESYVPQDPLIGEQLSHEDSILTNKMPEIQQSKERRQSYRKMPLVEHMLSNLESNKASLSKSRAVIESVDEEFDIVDISDLKQQVMLPRPGKSKAVKSLHATESEDMSVHKQNGQDVKKTFNNDVTVRDIREKHFQSDEETSDSSYSSTEELRVQISKKRNLLDERNNQPGPSKLKEWKRKVHLKKVALTQAKTSVDEVSLIRGPLLEQESNLSNKKLNQQSKQRRKSSKPDPLPEQESNLSNKKPNQQSKQRRKSSKPGPLPEQESNFSNKKPNQQSKQRRISSKPRAHVQKTVSADCENNKSSATSKSRGRGSKSILSDEVKMPVLETNLSDDNSRNVVNQNKNILRRSDRVSLPPGIWWSISGEPVQGPLNNKKTLTSSISSSNLEESGLVKNQAKAKNNRKSIYGPKSKKEKGDPKLKGKDKKLLQTRKAKKRMKEQTNKDDNYSKLLETNSNLKKQTVSKSPSSGKDYFPKGSDGFLQMDITGDILQTDKNLSQNSNVQGVCNVKPNLSRKRKHVDETDKAQLSPKKKLKSILKNKSKESRDFEDVKHLNTERIEDGNSTDESQESRTDHLSNYQSQQNNTSSPYFSKFEKIDSIFHSGPVLKLRPVEIASPVKPLVCALNSPEPHDEENLDNFAILSASNSQGEENCTNMKKRSKNKLSESSDTWEEDTLDVIPVVWDPDSKSDAVVDCIHPTERSKFIGNEHFKIWTSYEHNMFTTGKLKLAPLKKKMNTASMFDIITYYVANGSVKLTLHKSDYTLKTGDSFFIPPGNVHTITNLQEEEAMLTFTIVSLSGVTPT
ncbi:centromere protein C isoform X3 [Pseudophryne corroboree]|uniref:centromere protein C isoform X3 n=1 Tax=Pseudophryne corroboree TaxID=495146 RepID=UPI003081B55C